MTLANYKTLVFDCDGVILDSNRVKTRAFYNATLPYGVVSAQAMVDYHVSHGGISRYKKFEHFLTSIVPAGTVGPALDELLLSYAQEVRKGLLSCDVAEGLERLRKHTSDARWLVASGGDQQELRELFDMRDLAKLFDGGIFGSPDDKADIVAREIRCGNVLQPALFIGDSRYDHIVATSNSLDFVFLSGWTEFSDWQNYCSQHGITVLKQLRHLQEEKDSV